VLAASAVLARGQALHVFSEFQRVDPFGEIVPQDRGATPREILSPGVPRNGFLTLHVAVTVPVGEDYFLYVVPNPVDACHVSLYQERFVKTATGWIPDTLAPVTRLPYFGAMPDPAQHIPAQTTRLYLLDLWVPPNARPPGFRLEVQLKMGGWTVWPMEVRVLPFNVPAKSGGGVSRPLPPVDQPADAAARAPVEDLLAGVEDSREIDPDTVRAVIRRNAVQDMELAKSLDRAELRKVWESRPPGAEGYFRLRDRIYRQLAHPESRR
jgi:hypothetical protein